MWVSLLSIHLDEPPGFREILDLSAAPQGAVAAHCPSRPSERLADMLTDALANTLANQRSNSGWADQRAEHGAYSRERLGILLEIAVAY